MAAVTVYPAMSRYESRLHRLDDLGRIDRGWHSAHPESGPVHENAIKVAQAIVSDLHATGLPLPDVFPMPEGAGGISCRWALPDAELRAQIVGNGDSVELSTFPLSGSASAATDTTVTGGHVEQIVEWLAAQLRAGVSAVR